MSSNANPEYLDFWPVAAKAWLDFGITPVLFYIPDHAEDAPISQVMPADVPGGEVHTIPHLPDVNIVLQSSLLRFWGSCYYPDDIVIVSDIDMLPLSKAFFVDQLSGINNDRYVHLRCARGEYETVNLCIISPEKTVTEIPEMRHYPACYHIAQGSLMHDVLWSPDISGRSGEVKNTSDWKACCELAMPYFHYTHGKHGFRMVNTARDFDKSLFHTIGDELYTSARIHLFPRRDMFHHITHTKHQYDLLSRVSWIYCPRKLSQGYYSAAHLPRPYSRYEPVIDALLQRRAVPPVYRMLFRTTGMINNLGHRLPKRAVFLFHFFLLAGEGICAAIFRMTGGCGAGLLEEHYRALRSWLYIIRPGTAERYKQRKKALCRLLSYVRRAD